MCANIATIFVSLFIAIMGVVVQFRIAERQRRAQMELAQQQHMNQKEILEQQHHNTLQITQLDKHNEAMSSLMHIWSLIHLSWFLEDKELLDAQWQSVVEWNLHHFEYMNEPIGQAMTQLYTDIGNATEISRETMPESLHMLLSAIRNNSYTINKSK